jgi:hypothetical protein
MRKVGRYVGITSIEKGRYFPNISGNIELMEFDEFSLRSNGTFHQVRVWVWGCM